MSIKSYFPTHIYYKNIMSPQVSLVSDLRSEAKQIQKVDMAGNKWSQKNYVNGFTSYSSMSQLHLMSSTFMDLEKKIRPHVMRYAKHLEFDLQNGALRMTNCWVNVMPPGATHSNHIHPLSVISGTFYVQTPPGCSAFKIEDPRLGFFMAAPPKKESCREENKFVIELTPKSGHLVLFESWLRHEVPVNTTKKERISVSFNYDWV